MTARRARVLLACTALVTGAAWAAPRVPAAQVEKARKALGSPSAKIRIKAAEVMARSAAPDRAAVISALLADDDEAVRAAACDALALAGDRAAVPALEKASADAEALVATRAAAALGKLQHRVQLRATAGVNGGEAPVLAAMEKAAREAAAEAHVRLQDDEGARFAVTVTLQSAGVRTEAASTTVEVTVTGMVAELPGNRMRFSSRASVAAAQEGTVTARDIADLTRDAAAAAAQACAHDAAQWLQALPVDG